MSTPPMVCAFALGKGLYCGVPASQAHSHERDHERDHHRPAYFGTRLVCSCGDFNCASLD